MSYLSPYISRGVISTSQVFNHLRQQEYEWQAIEKYVQELAWRDYWQQVWIAKGEGIFKDLKNTQTPISNVEIPKAIIEAETGIEAVDQAIIELYQTGYMHNHMRMYVASICCNIANSHWLQPAKWMYSHLLDGDLASNQLSWQWIAGSFSNKKYFANQDNINTYFRSTQKGTFLDVDYDHFNVIKTPQALTETMKLDATTSLPSVDIPNLNPNKTTLIYNYYNLDPYWHEGEEVQRVLLLEPSVFKNHPVSQKAIDFAMGLAENIPDLKVFVGEFMELQKHLNTQKIIYKEHPLNMNYLGQEEQRDWLSSINGYFPSFFAFWKKCKKEISY